MGLIWGTAKKAMEAPNVTWESERNTTTSAVTQPLSGKVIAPARVRMSILKVAP